MIFWYACSVLVCVAAACALVLVGFAAGRVDARQERREHEAKQVKEAYAALVTRGDDLIEEARRGDPRDPEWQKKVAAWQKDRRDLLFRPAIKD